MLARAADALARASRAGDVVGRVGGEEFAVLAPEARLPGGVDLAERLRTALAAEFAGDPIPLTISFGVAERSEGESAAGLRARADHALYVAKAAGRDRVAASPTAPAADAAAA